MSESKTENKPLPVHINRHANENEELLKADLLAITPEWVISPCDLSLNGKEGKIPPAISKKKREKRKKFSSRNRDEDPSERYFHNPGNVE